MPPVPQHCQRSQQRTGQDCRALHEWIDNDPAHKAARHDLAQVLALAQEAEALFGAGAGQELLWHLLDDLKAKIGHALPEGPEAVTGALAQLGVK
ncbi:MAG: hypothetical protein HY794_00175 [Desulfarculus sp.]|nr:hypothetical protein [Desulfarculus sp.]